eukprot:5200177-Pleurochrysis_carterae.AAC.1
MVRTRSPTPALRDSLTSSNVDRLSLRRRTALAIFSASTESGSCAGMGSDRFSLWIECTKELSAVTVGSEMPRTSSEWIVAEIVALVAVDAALASVARMRS